MTYVLGAALLAAIGALVYLLVANRSLTKANTAADEALIAKTAAQATDKIEASQIQAKLINERDTALERAGLLAAEVADRDAKIHGLEAQLAESSAKVARLTVKLGSLVPVSDEGAAIVDDLLSTPILGGGKP